MVSYIFLFFLLSFGSVFFSFYGRKYEESLPISIGFIIIFLYVFYIFNILNIGYYFLLITIFFTYVYSIKKYIHSNAKSREKFLKSLFTPGLIVFIIIYVLLYFITKDRSVLLWDELRLWGAYPKILYYNGAIQLGNDAQLFSMMQSYEPGMPLFQYFFAKSTFRFLESDLFFAYSIFGVSMLIPLCKNIDIKKSHLIPVVVILFALIPYILSNNAYDNLTYYYTLFIDPLLGFCFAYLLYSCLKIEDSYYFFGKFIIGVLVLVLLKDTGIIFSLISIIAFIINHFKKTKRKNFVLYGTILFLTLTIFISWKITQKIYNSVNMYSTEIRYDEIKDFVKGSNENQQAIVKEFVNQLKNEYIYLSNFNFIKNNTNTILISSILFFFMIFILIAIKKSKKEYVTYKTSFILYWIGFMIFLLGLLLLYVFSLHRVASYQRYISSVFLAGFVLIFMILFEHSLKNNIRFIQLDFLFLIIAILVFPIKSPNINEQYFINIRNQIKNISDKISQKVPSNKQLIIMFTENYNVDFSYVIYHHNIYYELIDEQFKYLPMGFLDGENDNDELMNYDYVCMIVLSDIDSKNVFKETNISISNSELFSIEKRDTNIVLNEVK